MQSVRPLRRHDPPPRRGGPDRHRPVGPGARPAGVASTCAWATSFRVFHNHRVTAIDLRDPPTQPHRAGRDRRRTSRSSSTPASSCLGRTRGARRAARRRRRPHRGQVLLGRLGLIVHATAGFVDPGLHRHADARDHQPHARADQALRRACRSRSCPSWRSTRPPSAPTGIRTLGSHYHGQVAATESRYEGGPARPRRAVASRPCCSPPSSPPRGGRAVEDAVLHRRRRCSSLFALAVSRRRHARAERSRRRAAPRSGVIGAGALLVAARDGHRRPHRLNA